MSGRNFVSLFFRNFKSKIKICKGITTNVQGQFHFPFYYTYPRLPFILCCTYSARTEFILCSIHKIGIRACACKTYTFSPVKQNIKDSFFWRTASSIEQIQSKINNLFRKLYIRSGLRSTILFLTPNIQSGFPLENKISFTYCDLCLSFQTSDMYSWYRSVLEGGQRLERPAQIGWKGRGGGEGMICTTMEAWKGSPYRPPWQQRLTNELLHSLPRRCILYLY